MMLRPDNAVFCKESVLCLEASKEELRKDHATQKMKLEGQDSFSVKIGKIYYKCVNLLIGIGVSVEVAE